MKNSSLTKNPIQMKKLSTQQMPSLNNQNGTSFNLLTWKVVWLH